jgi:hypothetical protein
MIAVHCGRDSKIGVQSFSFSKATPKAEALNSIGVPKIRLSAK